MNAWLRLLAVGLVATAVGCGGDSGSGDGDPLVGTWVEQITSQGDALPLTFILGEKGKASIDQSEVNPAETCTGALHFTDMTWTSSATTFKVSGSKCSGGTHCYTDTMAGYGSCPKPAKEQRFVCTYSLSADQDTLEVSEILVDGSIAGPGTFTREK
jgi:hypothetical protein